MLILLTAFVAATLLVYLYASWLKRRGVAEAAKQQDSHSNPTPSGGGLAIVAVVVAGMLLAYRELDPATMVVLAATAGLSLLGWLDDRVQLPARVRIVLQAGAVAACLAMLPSDRAILIPGAPLLVDRLFVGVCWLWFLNLYNFMDGIDGIAGSQAVAMALGFVIVAMALPLPHLTVASSASPTISLALWTAGAAAGFLVWNWHPARIFMGDAGSVPLGLILGWLMIQLAASGALAAAFILPLYFTADSTYTLLKRLARGDRFWKPHREHFYQQAVRRGWRHDVTTLRVVVLNALLVAAAHLSLTNPVIALILAAASAILTLAELGGLFEGKTA